MDIKVSVCIPVWNQEKLVIRALDSIPRRDDLEVIAYNDGSTDKTLAVLNDYRDKHPNIRMSVYSDRQNRGLAYAKNQLMEHAQGEYIYFLDSDDWLETEKFSEVIDSIDGADIYCFDAVTNSGQRLCVTKETMNKYCGQPLRLIRREFLNGIKFDNNIWIAEDAPFNELMMAKNPRMVFTEKLVYHYNYPRKGSLCDLRERGAALDKIVLKNVIYIPWINRIGGVETFLYEMGLKYGSDFDMTLIFKEGDATMLHRIAKYMRVIRWKPEMHIKCDVFIFGYAHDIMDNVEADEYVQTFHADYINRHLNPCLDGRVTKRFGVAENTSKGIREHFDWAADIQTMYNPYTPKKPRKVLKLISATRLSAEKGFHRMVQLASALEQADIPFIWLVFTDDRNQDFPSKNVVKMPTTYDVLDYIAEADYLVQLSDTEGYSYSIVEALCAGTPVIVTEIPVAEEQGVINGKTGFILPFDMSNIPVEAIYKGLKKFKLEPRESHYETILSPGKSDYAEEHRDTVQVKVLQVYRDLQLGRVMKVGETFEAKQDRADHLVGMGLAEIVWW